MIIVTPKHCIENERSSNMNITEKEGKQM